jgi:esterase
MSKAVEQTIEEYDEFASLGENLAATFPDGDQSIHRLPVRRIRIGIADGDAISMLNWGQGGAPLVLLHGGGQNAHTWDSVVMILGKPALSIDLPGHGHSSWREDGDYSPAMNASSVADVLNEVATDARCIVGMSLGGLTAISLGARSPSLVRALVLVDVTPGSSARYASLTAEQRGAVSLVRGQSLFASLDEMVAAAVEAVPTRTKASLRSGVRHNAKQLANGQWTWRYDLHRMKNLPISNEALWVDLSSIHVPVMLVCGSASGFVHNDDVAEFRSRQPSARVEVVVGAGHSVQSERPAQLSELIRDFMSDLAH